MSLAVLDTGAAARLMKHTLPDNVARELVGRTAW